VGKIKSEDISNENSVIVITANFRRQNDSHVFQKEFFIDISNLDANGLFPFSSEYSLNFPGLASKFWAAKKIEDLLIQSNSEENFKKITSIGREFRFIKINFNLKIFFPPSLVTPNTSLIVLETLEQFLTVKKFSPK
jgi:hypothetical protein